MLSRVKTSDGSYTFYSKKFDEHYHSVTAGALEEARVKFVEPAEIYKGARILDFCFGLGYNTLAALQYQQDLNVTGIEIDRNILMEIPVMEVPSEYTLNFATVRLAVRDTLAGSSLKKSCPPIHIIIDDAEAAVKGLEEEYYDAIFFDPFSPFRHPSIWSENIFGEMHRVLKPGGRLTTYSCARKVRDNMLSAGFLVEDGPVFGRRGPSTIALKDKGKLIDHQNGDKMQGRFWGQPIQSVPGRIKFRY